jgi:methionyl-tRNA formyltransferase
MRAIFLGTPEFAVPSLRALVQSSYEVSAVFTQPDRPSGRGQKMHPPPVKQFAQSAGIPVFQPEKIRDEKNRQILSELRPDFIVVVAYGQILPNWLLQLPGIAPVNVHGSLLPRYRGAAPMAWAILNGDSATGVTTMIIEESVDSGPILLSREVPVSETLTAGELSTLLADIGAGLLIETLDGLRGGTVVPVLQDNRLATPAPRISKPMAAICWDEPAAKIHNKVRAFNPWPLAATVFNGQIVHIIQTLPIPGPLAHASEPATILGFTDRGIQIQCGGGTALEIREIQRPGRGRVSGLEFANGARLRPGSIPFAHTPH